jgi:hypothetical protein
MKKKNYLPISISDCKMIHIKEKPNPKSNILISFIFPRNLGATAGSQAGAAFKTPDKKNKNNVIKQYGTFNLGLYFCITPDTKYQGFQHPQHS